MFQTQIAFGLLVFGLISMAITWIAWCMISTRPKYEEPQVSEASEPNPPDETWWRDIFEYYD